MLQSVLFRCDASENCGHGDRVRAIKLEAAPRYHNFRHADRSDEPLLLQAVLGPQKPPRVIRPQHNLQTDRLDERCPRAFGVALQASARTAQRPVARSAQRSVPAPAAQPSDARAPPRSRRAAGQERRSLHHAASDRADQVVDLLLELGDARSRARVRSHAFGQRLAKRRSASAITSGLRRSDFTLARMRVSARVRATRVVLVQAAPFKWLAQAYARPSAIV